MAEKWTPLALDKALFANLDPDAVVGFMTAIENGFVNELGGHTRFPGLIERASLSDNGRVYLHDFKGDLIASTGKGQVYRINRNFTVENVTAVPVSGGRRTIFAKSDRDIMMAAGGPIVRLRNTRTELLSSAAPHATHVQWIDGYTLATEINSGRFYHSAPGFPDQWNPLDTFAADGNPDNINTMIVTPFREVMLGGAKSVEQFERLATGSVPFFRRWTVGEGVKLPYVMLFADNALWTINALTEFVRFSQQLSVSASAEIGKLLEAIDDWSDAWLGGFPDSPLHILGQKFMVLQAPNATNAYGTRGVTLLFDYKNKRWNGSLYGWNGKLGTPERWPGWSHWKLWDRVFVGGEGKIYELTESTHRHGEGVQRWLIRTSHVSRQSELQIKDFRLHVKRGIGTSSSESKVRVRVSRDGRPFSKWISRSLGKAGDRTPYCYFGGFGNGSTFMFEIACDDDCAIDLIGADALVEEIGH